MSFMYLQSFLVCKCVHSNMDSIFCQELIRKPKSFGSKEHSILCTKELKNHLYHFFVKKCIMAYHLLVSAGIMLTGISDVSCSVAHGGKERCHVKW